MKFHLKIIQSTIGQYKKPNTNCDYLPLQARARCTWWALHHTGFLVSEYRCLLAQPSCRRIITANIIHNFLLWSTSWKNYFRFLFRIVPECTKTAAQLRLLVVSIDMEIFLYGEKLPCKQIYYEPFAHAFSVCLAAVALTSTKKLILEYNTTVKYGTDSESWHICNSVVEKYQMLWTVDS